MRSYKWMWSVLLTGVLVASAAAQARAGETIVFLRHAEKPSNGLGQLTCQGLNRSLALPGVLLGRFGKPDFVYAPNPAVKIVDSGVSYYYVRPLATIEPTAIESARSVNTHYGYNDVPGILSLLISAKKANATIFVSWEHTYLQKIVQTIMNRYGGGGTVPAWKFGDYDTLYVVHLSYANGRISATFDTEAEGLNGQPTTCAR